MNRKFLVLFAAVGALLFSTINPVQAQQHRATRLGNPATRFANPLTSPDDFRNMLRSEALRKDVEFIARESGFKGSMDDLLQAAATADIQPLEIPVGTRLPAMSTRKGGKPELLRDVLWAGKAPIDAYEFTFTSQGERYRVVTPKPCANFWLEDKGPEPKPALALECDAPETVLQLRTAQVCVVVKNTGDGVEPLASVALTTPPGLTLTGITEGGLVSSGNATWQIPNLEAGGSRKLCAVYKTGRPGTMSFESTAQGRTVGAVTSHCETKVSGVAGVLLEMVDLEDPIEIGSNVTYEITVLNQGTATLTNVKLACTIPDLQEYVSGSGTSAVTAQDRAVTLDTLPELKSRETAKWQVIVKALAEGDARFYTKLRCDQIDSDVEKTESTHQY